MEQEQRRARAFGFVTLVLWATLGAALETAHAFKAPFYLEDELTRLLLRLAHAHGVGLSLVSLAYATVGVSMYEGKTGLACTLGRMLRVGSLLLPLGFALGAVGHPESDPSLPVVLAPLGALLLLATFARLAYDAWRLR